MNEKEIEIQLKTMKQQFPFLSDDVVYALLMMGINFVGNKTPFMLTGDIAWKALGLPSSREIKCIEMEIISTDEEQLSLLSNIGKEQGFVVEENKPLVFYAFGVLFNIAVRKEQFTFSRYLTCGGIFIPIVEELIVMKANRHSKDDLDDLLAVNKEILTIVLGKDDFEKVLAEIKNQGNIANQDGEAKED